MDKCGTQDLTSAVGASRRKHETGTEQKVQMLIISIDRKLQQSQTIISEACDLLGRLSHQISGVDLAELCGEENKRGGA
jgi:hypothetical protein